MPRRPNARPLSQRPRPVGAIAEDGELRARCCAKAMQHAAQLLGLPIGLDRHAAEDDLLTIIVAGLRNEHLEGPYLIAAHRPHGTGAEGQPDRPIAGSVAGPGSAPRLAPEQDGAAGRPGPPWPLRATIPASPPSSRAWRCRRRAPHAPAWRPLRRTAPPSPATAPGLSH